MAEQISRGEALAAERDVLCRSENGVGDNIARVSRELGLGQQRDRAESPIGTGDQKRRTGDELQGGIESFE